MGIRIFNGPDRFDLFLSLINMTALEFDVRIEGEIRPEPLALIVQSIELESGGGTKFNLQLRGAQENVYYKAFYDSEVKTGVMRFLETFAIEKRV